MIAKWNRQNAAVLIETLWNVKKSINDYRDFGLRINRNIVECKESRS